jgi:hypothetical protein
VPDPVCDDLLPEGFVPEPLCSEEGLPLPDPYLDYIACPHCGEPEVELWCYQKRVQCHACGQWIDHTTPVCYGTLVCQEIVKRGLADLPDDDQGPNLLP